MKLEYITLAIIVAFIAAFAYVSSTGNHEWGGSDDMPENVINDLKEGYGLAAFSKRGFWATG